MLATTACVALPEDGPVVPVEDQVRTQPDQGVERRAQPPQEGDPAQVIVNGFLQAMTAYPVRTDVARLYLASDIRNSWDPGGKIVTYESRDSATGNDVVRVDIQGANWIDSRGTWRGRRGSGDVQLSFPMVQENEEWRIAKAPDEFVVTDDWFQDHYRPAAVYFLDPTASILVPEPIFVRSEQVAGSLIEALLDGPGTDVVRSFVPTGLRLGLSVPVSADGEASIPLEGDVSVLSPEAAKLMVYQFAWTLRQDPRVSTFSITLNDQPVTFAGGGTEFSVDLGSEYAPTDVQASSALFVLRNGLLESGDADASTPVRRPARSEAVRRRAGGRQPPRRPGRQRLRGGHRAAAVLGRRRRRGRPGGAERGNPAAQTRVGLRRPSLGGRPGSRRRSGQHDRHRAETSRAHGSCTCQASPAPASTLPRLARRHPTGGRRARPASDSLRVSRIRYNSFGQLRRRHPVAQPALGRRTTGSGSATSPGVRRPASGCSTSSPAASPSSSPCRSTDRPGSTTG